jgi:hypothetical protein
MLAILLRRRLRHDEYPRGVGDLVASVSARFGTHGPELARWLEQALQLQRASFASAVDAEAALSLRLQSTQETTSQSVRRAVDAGVGRDRVA